MIDELLIHLQNQVELARNKVNGEFEFDLDDIRYGVLVQPTAIWSGENAPVKYNSYIE